MFHPSNYEGIKKRKVWTSLLIKCSSKFPYLIEWQTPAKPFPNPSETFIKEMPKLLILFCASIIGTILGKFQNKTVLNDSHKCRPGMLDRSETDAPGRVWTQFKENAVPGRRRRENAMRRDKMCNEWVVGEMEEENGGGAKKCKMGRERFTQF